MTNASLYGGGGDDDKKAKDDEKRVDPGDYNLDEDIGKQIGEDNTSKEQAL